MIRREDDAIDIFWIEYCQFGHEHISRLAEYHGA